MPPSWTGLAVSARPVPVDHRRSRPSSNWPTRLLTHGGPIGPVPWSMGSTTGDYYRRNLLVRDGVVQGVIDWDEARPGPLIAEVAFAAWEFGHDDELNLVPDQFQRFVGAYRNRATHPP